MSTVNWVPLLIPYKTFTFYQIWIVYLRVVRYYLYKLIYIEFKIVICIKNYLIAYHQNVIPATGRISSLVSLVCRLIPLFLPTVFCPVWSHQGQGRPNNSIQTLKVMNVSTLGRTWSIGIRSTTHMPHKYRALLSDSYSNLGS